MHLNWLGNFSVSCSFLYSAWRPPSGSEISLCPQHTFSLLDRLKADAELPAQLQVPGQVPLAQTEGVTTEVADFQIPPFVLPEHP